MDEGHNHVPVESDISRTKGTGCVKEKTQLDSVKPLSQERRQQHEVIVAHPNMLFFPVVEIRTPWMTAAAVSNWWGRMNCLVTRIRREVFWFKLLSCDFLIDLSYFYWYIP